MRVHNYGSLVIIEKQMVGEQKPGLNVEDRYAMVVKKDSCITVGCLPQKIAVATQQGSEIASSHRYGLPTIFFWPRCIGAQLTVLA